MQTTNASKWAVAAALDPEDVAILPGVASVLDWATFLLTDRGQSVLVPTPYWAGFNAIVVRANDKCIVGDAWLAMQPPKEPFFCVDVMVLCKHPYSPQQDRNNVTIEPVPMQNHTKLTVAALTKAFDAAKQAGRPATMLLLNNPNNPTVWS